MVEDHWRQLPCVPRETLAYIKEFFEKNEYVCQRTAYECINYSDVEPEL